MLNNLEDVVYIEVLLEGEFPAGFKRLQRSVRELLNDFRSESGGLVDYSFTDPNQGTAENVEPPSERNGQRWDRARQFAGERYRRHL